MKKRILSLLLAFCMALTLLPMAALATEDAPADGPTINVNTELYQVEVKCDENGAHYWSYPSKHNWSTTADQFTVGEVRENDLANGTAADYPYICPVIPSYSLDTCLANVNADFSGHRMVTTEGNIPIAYYYWNSTDGWTLLRNHQPDANVT